MAWILLYRDPESRYRKLPSMSARTNPLLAIPVLDLKRVVAGQGQQRIDEQHVRVDVHDHQHHEKGRERDGLVSV